MLAKQFQLRRRDVVHFRLPDEKKKAIRWRKHEDISWLNGNNISFPNGQFLGGVFLCL